LSVDDARGRLPIASLFWFFQRRARQLLRSLTSIYHLIHSLCLHGTQRLSEKDEKKRNSAVPFFCLLKPAQLHCQDLNIRNRMITNGGISEAMSETIANPMQHALVIEDQHLMRPALIRDIRVSASVLNNNR
jgi:hypothetical protein